MNAGHKALAVAFAAGLAFAALAPATHAAGSVRAPQSEPRRRPQGPVAGPVIKLPRGEGAGEERTQPQPAGTKDDGAASATRRWEYCAITGFVSHQKGLSISSPTYTPAAVIRYFAGGTEEVEGQVEEEALANAFVRLGEEGWELTGLRTDLSLNEGNGHSRTVYFFKRPKARE